MKKVLILSATNNSNLILAKELSELVNSKNVNFEVESFENYAFPIFNASTYKSDKEKNIKNIKLLTKKMVEANGLIICSPEYNGSIPPIVTNAIAWVSVSTDYWKDAFKNKVGLIASSSGGAAIKFNIAMKNQLEHLGMVVMPRLISTSSKNPLRKESAKKILKHFINLI